MQSVYSGTKHQKQKAADKHAHVKSEQAYYRKQRNIIKKLLPPLGNLTWYADNNQIFLLNDRVPLGWFEFKIIAYIQLTNGEWEWVWEKKDNVIDKRLYPETLEDDIVNNHPEWTISDKERKIQTLGPEEPRLVASLYALKGHWYAYLIEDSLVTIVVTTRNSFVTTQ